MEERGRKKLKEIKIKGEKECTVQGSNHRFSSGNMCLNHLGMGKFSSFLY